MWMTGSLHGIHLSQVYLIMPYVILFTITCYFFKQTFKYLG